MRFWILLLGCVWSLQAATAPVADWDCSDGSGAVLSDQSGNGHHATVVGATWTSGVVGSGLAVDGNAWIELPSTLPIGAQGTVSIWCRTTTNATDLAMLFYAGSGAGGNGMGPESELHLHLQSTERPGAFAGDGTAVPAVLAPGSGTTVHDGAWHHVALVWTAGGDLRLLLDGTLYASGPMLGAVPPWNGILRLATSAASDRSFIGSIDEIQVFATALTDAEVRALSGPGLLTVSTPAVTVAEGTANATVKVKRVGGTNGSVSVSYATSDQEAAAGSDYTAKSGTLTWTNGNRSDKSISIPITNDAVAEGPERFQVLLTNPTNGAQIGETLATVRINDNEGPGSLEWTVGSVTVAESTATVTVTARRVGGSSGAVSATWQTVDGSALAGQDYVAGSGTLNWASGETANKTAVITLVNDIEAESVENFTVQLIPVTAFPGLPTEVQVTITDNDQPGTITLTKSFIEVAEDATSVTFTAQRLNGNVGSVSVSYATENGTATAGADYTTKSGTLTWASGNTANKSITVSLLGDAIEEPEEAFRVRLSGPTGGATLGAIAQGVVRIRDDDRPLAVYRLDEASGSVAWDDMDHAMNGTVTGAAWVPGRTGNALAFNGTTTKVDLPLGKIRSRVGTIMAWVKAPSIPAAPVIVAYGSSGTAGNGFGTEQELHLHIGSDGKAGAFIEGGANDVNLTGGPVVADGTWHHLAFVWDVNGQATLYVDAQIVGTVAHDALDFSFSKRFRIGQPNSTSNFFAGAMDDVRIWTRALSLAEVRAQSGIVQEVLLTTPTTILGGDTTYDGSHLIVEGTTVTIAGSHTFAAVTIRNNGVITHPACTTTEEFRLELLVGGTVTVEAGSQINVSGKGYAPGRTVGNAPMTGTGGSWGGSHGGRGTTSDLPSNQVYGDVLAPVYPGAGSGTYASAGCRGGGAFHLVAGALVMEGTINADGVAGTEGGAGGSIWVEVGSISGSGLYRAVGGNGTYGAGGGGRIALAWSSGSISPSQYAARGGPSSYSGHAGAGTVSLQPVMAIPTIIIDGLTVPRRGLPTPLWWGDRNDPLDDPSVIACHIQVRGVDVEIDPTPSAVTWTTATLDNGTVTTDGFVAGIASLVNGAALESFASTSSTERRLDVAVGTLTVDASSRIDAKGKGYRPGYTLGNIQMTGLSGSWGGTHGGIGSTGDYPSNAVYGDFLMPTTLGSGTGIYGGAGSSGGGAIHVTVQNLTMNGTVNADGGDGSEGGAGGSIWVEAGTIAGNGIYRAVGGNGTYGAGGGGRIAVTWTSGGLPAGQCAARGGTSGFGGIGSGGSGTVFLQSSGQTGTLIIDGLNVPRLDLATPIYFGERGVSVDDPVEATYHLVIRAAGAILDPTPTAVLWPTLVIDNAWATTSKVTTGSFTLSNGAVLFSEATTVNSEARLHIVADDITVGLGCRIDAEARGYLPGRTHGNVAMPGTGGSWGGSHGGYASTGDLPTNEVYGNFAVPTTLGSGSGSYSSPPRPGGGAIHIQTGSLSLVGTITADGGSGAQGGAGGSVWIEAGSMGGTGIVRAVGGNGTYGAGGGGRIALHLGSGTFPFAQCATRGGSSSIGGIGSGNPGTTFRRTEGEAYGVLHVTNGGYGVVVPRSTPLFFGEVFQDSDLICPWDFTLDVVSPATLSVPYPHQLDGDQDGLTSWDEAALGTLPRDPDTNDDGIIDGLAVASGIDPFALDQDGDGIANAAELAQGTDPFSVDTDWDGVADPVDAYPLDRTRTTLPPSVPGDVTAPVITITMPTLLIPLN